LRSLDKNTAKTDGGYLLAIIMDKSDWHSNVYHEKGEIVPEDWASIRLQIIERDKKCFRCNTRQKRKLTVHHIIPRDGGGEENPENLITLCRACHDIVEIAGCRSLVEIEATVEKRERKHTPKKPRPFVCEPDPEREETFARPEWHKWVYGGVRRST
jgi:hypothetical protein